MSDAMELETPSHQLLQTRRADRQLVIARGFDDDADVELRDRSRWGDPMAGKLKKKKGGDGFDLPPPLITEANRAMMEASGLVVPQEVPQHSWMRRGVAAPVNHYSLCPGRHWDGVDRSTGFEQEMFKAVNQRNAQEREARMWAQEDM
ncbi:hypothetical protein COO60DRAFT_1707249 [Scenedesmus sp. NREL 46B-D3]|nr:hypothetical protein COO60DRAFT_1707249 [Scenedesmus sp. NREL 46B-D3]